MKQLIEIHIDALNLHGFPAKDRYRIAEAVQQELGRLLTERGLPASFRTGTSVPQLQTGAFEMQQHSPATQTGQGIAAALYNGFQQQQEV